MAKTEGFGQITAAGAVEGRALTIFNRLAVI